MRATRFDPVSFSLGKEEGGGGTTDYNALSNRPSIGGVTLTGDIPVTLTGDTSITVTNTGTASAIGYSVTHKDSGVTAGSKGDTTNQTPGFGGTFKTLSATVDAKGHVTNLAERNVKVPDAEATQSAKGLMSAEDKAKLDTLIDSTLSNTGKAADAKVTGDKIASLETENALLRELINGIDAPVYRKASGNPVTFDDAKAANLKDVAVTITPTQSGSGDPYPPGGGKNKANVSDFTLVKASSRTRTVGVSIPAGTYTVSMTVSANSTTNVSLIYTLSNGVGEFTIAENGATGRFSFTRTFNNAVVSLYFYIPGTEADDASVSISQFQIEPGENATGYAPYSNIRPITAVTSVSVTRTGENGANPQSVTVQFVDSNSNPLTVYGGTLDMTTGELSVTWANIASYNGETLPERWMSDRDVYAEGATPTTGAQVVYELAAPVTYQLTPAQLATLSGYNAVSTDAESLNVTYRADTALTLGGG